MEKGDLPTSNLLAHGRMKPRRRAELHLQRARKALAEHRYLDAQAACREALQLDPGSSDAYLLLAEMAWEHGELAPSAALFRKSLELNTQNVPALIGLARTLSRANQFEEAVEAANRAFDLKPRDAASVHALGLVFANFGDHARATALFQTATDLAPRNTRYLFDLGIGRQILGALDLSEACFRRCVEIYPGFYQAHAKLVELRRQTSEQNNIDKLERLFGQAPDDIDRTLTIGYALAKSYEDLGDANASLESLRRGKQARRRRVSYRYERDQALFAAATDTFPARQSQGAPLASDAPIFIVGMPRSGTSLTDRILASHPDVTSLGELQTVAILVHQLTGVSLQALEAEALRRAASIDLASLGQTYLQQTAAMTRSGRRRVDKLPFNFLFAGVIHRALPNARIVCLKRDPVDVCLSNYRTFFSPGSAFHDYAYDLCDIARYYVMFDRLVAHWSAVLPGDRFMSLSYEALVADQEAETRRLLEFCGLTWEARCLDFQKNATGLMTPSVQQVRQPMFTTSIGRWRQYGDALQPMINLLRDADVTGASS